MRTADSRVLRRAIAALALATVIPLHTPHADPIHAVDNGAYWHHDSGWIFPARVGEFSRVGIPQDVAGSPEAAAYYARVIAGQRYVVSIELYPNDSATQPRTPDDAQAILAQELGAQFTLASNSSFELQSTSSLTARKVVFRSDSESNTTQTRLYFVTRGNWVAKVRGTCPANDAAAEIALDEFVRSQQWDELRHT